MNLFFILLLLALIAGGVYVYQRLVTIEREIRAEQGSENQAETAPEVKPEAPPRPEPVPVAAVNETMDSRIMRLIEETPGLSQTELYEEFADTERRDIQKLLREMDQQGRLRREKKGNSYRLHPL